MKTLKDLKVGDTVWTIQKGKSTVSEINPDVVYPIVVDNDEYTIKGKFQKNDELLSLFLENPFEIKQPFTPRWVMTLDGWGEWVKRWLVAESSIKLNYILANGVTNEQELENWNGMVIVREAIKEIEEVEVMELTLEDIAIKYNVSVDQIKIKK